MAAHRYWRVLITGTNGSNDSGYASLTEAHFSTSVGGANAAIGKTYAASSVGFGWVAANAFDGSTAEPGWHSNGTTPTVSPEWISVDFGAGGAVDIIEFGLTSRNASDAATQAPKNFRLQYSDDNAAWTDLYIVLNQTGWGGYETRKFAASVGLADLTLQPDDNGHRYWRIYVAQAGDDFVSASTIELRNDADQLQADGVAIRSGFVESDAANAFDVNSTTRWSSAYGMPAWIGKDFGAGASRKVRRITWANRSDGTNNQYATQAPSQAYVQFSDDGVLWKTQWAINDATPWTTFQTRSYSATAAVTPRPQVFVCT